MTTFIYIAMSSCQCHCFNNIRHYSVNINLAVRLRFHMYEHVDMNSKNILLNMYNTYIYTRVVSTTIRKILLYLIQYVNNNFPFKPRFIIHRLEIHIDNLHLIDSNLLQHSYVHKYSYVTKQIFVKNLEEQNHLLENIT